MIVFIYKWLKNAVFRREYEAYHGHWPHHLFFLLPESNRGIGYGLRGIYIYVTSLRFKLSGRRVLSARFNIETAGFERERPEI
eukprot:COSAG06_NODE_2992_length_5967_cov_4.409995_6_plen_83_part_00